VGSEATSAGAANSQSDSPQFDAENPVVRIETSQGAITLRLDAVRAPGTVQNFLNYARDGFYDNTLVHYVDPDKTVLAGGYSTDQRLKPARLPIRSEADNELKNVRGTVAMSREIDHMDSATSQFFINLADAPQRDHQGDSAEQFGYCVFGEVVEGLDVAQRISNSATTKLPGDLSNTPDPPVRIDSVRIVR
jgi:cyclophilin family peptidyl-prolyl cis-trans isomerase